MGIKKNLKKKRKKEKIKLKGQYIRDILYENHTSIYALMEYIKSGVCVLPRGEQ